MPCIGVDRVSSQEPLAGTAALVTGALSGIGEATARHLADLGGDVAPAAPRQDRIEQLASELPHVRTAVVTADLRRRDEAERAVPGHGRPGSRRPPPADRSGPLAELLAAVRTHSRVVELAPDAPPS